jgi:tetratricopeptide (TPR) repeat protein
MRAILRGYVRRASPALPAALGLLVFAPALAGGFVHDDRAQIAANPLLRSLGGLPALWSTSVWAGAGSGSSFYRPLMMTSFALDAAVFGLQPQALHAVQLVLYAACVALAGALVASVERSRAVGFSAALLLAVHPVNAEPAAWLSARCDLLAGLGVFGALWLHRAALSGEGRRAARAGASLAFLLALTAKESAVVALAGCLALDRALAADGSLRALSRRYAGYAAAALVYAALRVHALGALGAGLGEAVDPARALAAFGQGLARLVWPVGLTIAPPEPGAGHALLGAAGLASACALGGIAFRRRSVWGVPLALGAASLAVGALAAARIGELADRYLLVPVACGVWLLAHALRGRAGAFAPAAVAAAALALASASARHVTVYQSDAVLWAHAAARNPASARAAQNLAVAELEAGDLPAAEHWLERAAALAPGDPLIALDRAVLYDARGERARAAAELRALADRDPGYWPARLRLGHLALEAGDLDTAASHYEAALRVHPLAAEALAGLGVVRYQQGRADEARAAIARALALDPGVQNAAALRRLLAEGGR